MDFLDIAFDKTVFCNNISRCENPFALQKMKREFKWIRKMLGVRILKTHI